MGPAGTPVTWCTCVQVPGQDWNYQIAGLSLARVVGNLALAYLARALTWVIGLQWSLNNILASQKQRA